eukprot:1422077-Prymnesium_polylepis.1
MMLHCNTGSPSYELATPKPLLQTALIYYMWVPRVGTCRALQKGMTLGHGGRGRGRTPPSRWAKPCIRQRCSGRRLNPSTAHYIL